MDYMTLKRQTLQELLEARGKSAGRRTKVDIIAALIEDDWLSGEAAVMQPKGEMDALREEVAWRLTLYKETLSEEIMTKILSKAQAYVLAQMNGVNPTQPDEQRVGERSPGSKAALAR
ncbi:Hypothetical predicted protein [Pelobates cultripes]|uniref:Uncharacterized protein n=1 Tax=Pelobates cultripes TaxID=61616 RepID=A0AAD1RK65_PELCU|nr:Hypothetical predicted protein [Pelobates cultripes]